MSSEFSVNTNSEDNPADPTRNICQTILDEMQENWRIKNQHPTKAEVVLKILLEHPTHQIDFTELIPYFEGTENPENAAWMVLKRLDKKLREKGYSLQRPNIYKITKLEEDNTFSS